MTRRAENIQRASVKEFANEVAEELNPVLEKANEKLKEAKEEKEEAEEMFEELKEAREEPEKLKVRIQALGSKIGRLKREAELAEWDRGVLFDIEEEDDEWIREVQRELRAEKNRRKKTGDFEGAEPRETKRAMVAVPAGYRNKKQ